MKYFKGAVFIIILWFAFLCNSTELLKPAHGADLGILCSFNSDTDADIDGIDLANFKLNYNSQDIENMAEAFGRADLCPARTDGIVKTWHPRLLVLGANRQECENDLGRVKSQISEGGIYNHAYTQAVTLNGDGNAGRYGAGYMLKMLKAVEDDSQKDIYVNEAKDFVQSGNFYIDPYQVFFICAMFDWFSSDWNESETEALIAYMKEVIRRDEWSDKTVLGNHFHEDHAITRVLPGLVLAGESAGAQNGNDLWFGYGAGSQGIKGAKYWVNEELVPTFNDLFGSGGMNPEGNSYWNKGHPHLSVLAMSWSSCTDENLFSKWTVSDFSESLLYAWRSSDHKLLPWSDGVSQIGVTNWSDRTQIYGHGYRTPFTIFLPLMRWHNSQEASYIYNMYQYPDYLEGISHTDTGTSYGDIFIKYIFGDAFGPRTSQGLPLHDPEPVDLSSLSKSRYFEGYNAVVVKSGWGDDDVLFGYKQNRYIAGHDNADAGSFIISRNTDLAMDSGYYSSNGDILDDHTMYYSPRTIAHNTITVVKPGQYTTVQFWSDARNIANDDGGQRGFGTTELDGSISSSYDPPFFYDEFIEDRFSRGDINRYEHDADIGYTYFSGDVTPAYFTDSVSNFTRTVLTPDARYYIILDRVSSTSPDYPKRWLLHTENQPVAVDGSIGEQNSADGSIGFSGTQFYAENGPSRLFVKMLVPENSSEDTVLFRGGPGYEYWYGYDENGFNADQTHDSPSPLESPGNWRVEEKISSETDSVFLNVLFATGNGAVNMGRSELLVSDSEIYAVCLVDYICVFSKPETRTGSYLDSFSYTSDGSESRRHIITDLYPGADYNIYEDDVLLPGAPFSSSSNGIISFVAAGSHRYNIIRR